jgi:hypothetical protein
VLRIVLFFNVASAASSLHPGVTETSGVFGRAVAKLTEARNSLAMVG